MDMSYRFRSATCADVPLLRAWRSCPHLVEWCRVHEYEHIEETLAGPHVAAHERTGGVS